MRAEPIQGQKARGQFELISRANSWACPDAPSSRIGRKIEGDLPELRNIGQSVGGGEMASEEAALDLRSSVGVFPNVACCEWDS